MTNLSSHGKLIYLPGFSVSLPCPKETHEQVLVAGGRPPAAEWLTAIAKGRKLHAIDHGLDACFAAGLVPASLLGDGDSASEESWQKAQQLNIATEKHPIAKDLTDTELCLQKIKAGDANAFVLLTGCFGGRFDHLFSTAYSFLHSGLQGFMADSHEVLLFLRDCQKLTVNFDEKPKALSLLPLSPVCKGVDSLGVRWPLSNATLSQHLPSAVSNELLPDSNTWKISLQHGLLGVYICFSENQLV